MSSEFILLLVLLFVGCSIAMLVAIPWALSQRAGEEQNDSWRDSTGGLIKLLRPVLRLYSSQVYAGMSKPRYNELAGKLQISGLSYVISPEEFVVLKRLSVLGFALFSAYVVWLLGLGLKPASFSIVFGLVVIGYFYPDIWLNDKIKYRKHMIEKQFPFFLDLLVLIMRAGLPFTGAIQQSTNKMTDGPLKAELARYQRDIRTGVEKQQALEQLAKRVGLASVTNFVASIIQAEESGASITSVLQNQSKQRRKERFLKAEKLANEAPVKMLLPLVGLLFPLTFIVIAIPIVVQFMDSGLIGKGF
ncbi:type II secretion system F family protein [Aliamphritea spongicola]|uniref:type II secretion system F family protein n=1 Tax=Aliamphritea spongicola TaxID=707589 RepID=UPI00196ACD93|nr:type II secretion system F family protein [Aliamphritea spongicola]MBN3564717.1 type II secretion system F family protein [Aliamphritea spongicola]